MKFQQKASKTVWAGLALFAFSACQQDPFPEQGKITEKKVEQKSVAPPYGIDAADSVEFYEGRENVAKVKVRVPEPFTPVVSVIGLPAGATFDPSKLTLSWTPGYDASNDAYDPSIRTKDYPVTLMLRSSSDPITFISKAMTIRVKDVARKYDLELGNANGNFVLKEGKEFTQSIRVVSEDYPKGPFQFSASGLPPGAVIDKDPKDPSKLGLSFVPSYQFATVSNGTQNRYAQGGCRDVEGLCKLVDFTLTVRNPAGYQIERHVYWQVEDIRMQPKISAPAEVVQGSDVSFQVTAYDLNGEMNPEISVVNKPTIGMFETQIVKEKRDESDKLPIRTLSVRWKDIPADKMGTTQKLSFTACVKKDSSEFVPPSPSSPTVAAPSDEDEAIAAARSDDRPRNSLCKNFDVQVVLSGVVHKAPLISREAYPAGKAIYIRAGETSEIKIPVTDTEDASVSPKVSVEMNGGEGEAKWSGGKLSFSPKKPGIRLLSLKAESQYGVSAYEPILYDVLPAHWAETLILWSSKEHSQVSSELAPTRALYEFSDAIDVSTQSLDERTLALRSSVMITSDLIRDADRLEQVEKTIQNVPVLFISSPLLTKLPKELSEELRQLKVGSSGRLSDNGNTPLDQLILAPEVSAGLSKLIGKVHLEGKITAESSNPTILAKDGDSPCKTVLSLKKEGEFGGKPVVMTCPRARGGTLVLAGFEWSDIKGSDEDKDIHKKWLKELMR